MDNKNTNSKTKQAINSIASNFDPKKIVSELLKFLNDREKEVITKRYSLKNNPKHTLESIGKSHSITRERVRQIENLAIKKIKNISEKLDAIHLLDKMIDQTLDKYLGALGEDTLIKKILSEQKNKEENKESYNTIKFLVDKILDEKYETRKEDNDFYPILRKKNHDWNEFQDAINIIIQLFEKKDQPIHKNKLWKNYDQEPEINFSNNSLNEEILLNYLEPSKKIKENPLGELGLINWKSIVPKRMSDKIYLVMKNLGYPLHFREITEEINKMNFDKKVAHPATIHNELILDDKYILVGRGIYGLKKWNYEAGKVSDVVEKILKKEGPMKKDELIEKVSQKKLVKKSTINLAIINNSNIQKNKDGQYFCNQKKKAKK
ncbi:hypothetical protein K8R66_04075 [bacterium]|nr:hypothetical protein [bacterium]